MAASSSGKAGATPGGKTQLSTRDQPCPATLKSTITSPERSVATWAFRRLDRADGGLEFPSPMPESFDVYTWGNEPPDETRACFGLDPDDPERGFPTKVGSFLAGRGPFGTLDQAGNVWEWCRDAWNPYTYEKRAKAGNEPLNPVNELFDKDKEGWRVLRGGGWFHPARHLRSAYRLSYLAQKWLVGFGFRVAAGPISRS